MSLTLDEQKLLAIKCGAGLNDEETIIHLVDGSFAFTPKELTDYTTAIELLVLEKLSLQDSSSELYKLMWTMIQERKNNA